MNKQKWGLFNHVTKRYCFGIKADSEKKAYKQAKERLGYPGLYQWRWEIRKIPKNWINKPNEFWNKRKRG